MKSFSLQVTVFDVVCFDSFVMRFLCYLFYDLIISEIRLELCNKCYENGKFFQKIIIFLSGKCVVKSV